MDNQHVVQALQHLLGTTYDETTKSTVTELTGRTRVVGPNDITTREFDLQRVHVRVGAQGRIEAITFG
ncbi:I78 family peptidase inhibitor [Pseudomonas typographi]|uniref:I78 family peptidase inhibitor n=1 Tax=Pseudomonas typographi TaxID=2715964 RepID=UPI001683E31C|nr:I78 family peptidase inhibitor [Pseudomonas typographi]MBD1550059.1 hypothetical protein [Pseudomonas typographi]MBD1585441.1 hypothetical protein [Pseudomonas typographi]